jgi:hypothetical protein
MHGTFFDQPGKLACGSNWRRSEFERALALAHSDPSLVGQDRDFQYVSHVKRFLLIKVSWSTSMALEDGGRTKINQGDLQ